MGRLRTSVLSCRELPTPFLKIEACHASEKQLKKLRWNMTDEDKQWLERHGFLLNEELSRRMDEPVYARVPTTQDSVIVICCVQRQVSWLFFIIVDYNGMKYKYAHETLALTDSFFEHFIWRWNDRELPKMLVQCNPIYTIPEDSAN